MEHLTERGRQRMAARSRTKRRRRARGVRVALVEYAEDHVPDALISLGFLRPEAADCQDAIGAALTRLIDAQLVTRDGA